MISDNVVKNYDRSEMKTKLLKIAISTYDRFHFYTFIKYKDFFFFLNNYSYWNVLKFSEFEIGKSCENLVVIISIKIKYKWI